MYPYVALFKMPTLMKATADDENPCPGYLFQEIGSILCQFIWSKSQYVSRSLYKAHRNALY
jgi:hypothetical protein